MLVKLLLGSLPAFSIIEDLPSVQHKEWKNNIEEHVKYFNIEWDIVKLSFRCFTFVTISFTITRHQWLTECPTGSFPFQDTLAAQGLLQMRKSTIPISKLNSRVGLQKSKDKGWKHATLLNRVRGLPTCRKWRGCT